ncbi:MAG TPA: hypothetical protein VNK52_04610 [Hyphomicrobiaceae bacterium]|nr:hypothetical protein [Hyphomicrobiaceae bacterium]
MAAALLALGTAAVAQPPPSAGSDGSAASPIGKRPIPKCQGLKEPECNANPDCMFVPEGVRKDGQPIPAYCRAKPLLR